MAYAKDKQILASAGFDKNIYLWDINKAMSVSLADLETNSKSTDFEGVFLKIFN